MNASVVTDLGFGDSGKGLMVDYLCSKNPRESIVVRHSGGQNCGHTVIRNGIKHIHSNFGSGTLLGVPSYFSEHTTFYLPTILREMNILQGKGMFPTLYIHPLAKVTTPYDVAWNRIQESKLKHGSVGLGIGATMVRNNTTGYKLHAIDLKFPEIAQLKIEAIKKYYEDKLAGDKTSLSRFWDECMYIEGQFNPLVDYNDHLFEIKTYDFLRRYSHAIFEGSQGIMLDMDHGFFPHVTYANTTSKNAIEICEKLNIRPRIYYVTRCYQTRHGNGPMTSNLPVELINNEEEINVNNQWQGSFKTAELDYNLLNYALDVDNIYSRGLNKNLVVTCLDQRPEFEFDYDKIKTEFVKVFESYSPSANTLEEKYSNILSLNTNK